MLLIILLLISIIGSFNVLTTSLSNVWHFVFSVVKYFLWAFSVAYIIYPMTNFLIKKLKINKAVAIIFVYVLFVALIVLSFFFLFPLIFKNMTEFISNATAYGNKAYAMVQDFSENLPVDVGKMMQDMTSSAIAGLNEYITSLSPITLFGNVLTNMTAFVANAFMVIMLSIYMLYSREKISRAIKNIIIALFKERRSERLFTIGNRVDGLFTQFIVGRLLDSIIVFVLTLLSFIVLKIPYAVLFSVLVGVTDFIPYFGPIIGFIPTVIILFLIDPMKAIIAAIVLIVIQQLDGLIIGPRILGERLGLHPIVILSGVIIGQQVMGFVGLLIGVPVVAAIKLLLYDDYIVPMAKRVKKQDRNVDGANDEADANGEKKVE